MSPQEAAQMLADTLNLIESFKYITYPHPRPVGISIRILKPGIEQAAHPDDTRIVAKIWDEGDGLGWRVSIPKK